PRRAAAVIAAAAATDVLPTPPEPQNTTTSRAASSASSDGTASAVAGLILSRSRRSAPGRSAPAPRLRMPVAWWLRSSHLLAERVGDHPGDPQAVVTDEQVRHEQEVEVDLVAQTALVRGAAPPQRHRQ